MEIMIIALLSVCAVLLILVLVRVSSAGKGESALRIENMHQFKMMNEMISDELRNQAEACLLYTSPSPRDS